LPFSRTDMRTFGNAAHGLKKSWLIAGRNPANRPELKNPFPRGEAVSTVPDEIVLIREELSSSVGVEIIR
jgi:hypothetical protein